MTFLFIRHNFEFDCLNVKHQIPCKKKSEMCASKEERNNNYTRIRAFNNNKIKHKKPKLPYINSRIENCVRIPTFSFGVNKRNERTVLCLWWSIFFCQYHIPSVTTSGFSFLPVSINIMYYYSGEHAGMDEMYKKKIKKR